MRESDGIYFLYNGEGCVRVSPFIYMDVPEPNNEVDESAMWHREYGKIPDIEKTILNELLHNNQRVFKFPGYGRYQVIARGTFYK